MRPPARRALLHSVLRPSPLLRGQFSTKLGIFTVAFCICPLIFSDPSEIVGVKSVPMY